MQAVRKIKNKLKIALRFIPALRLVWQSSPGWTIARLVLISGSSGFITFSDDLFSQANY